jgi:beta-galactosidase
VQNGGVLVLGPRSGVKDRENAVFDELLPGPLRPLAGCHVEEYDAFSTILGLELKVKNAAGDQFRVNGLADILVPETGKPFLWYVNHYYAGKPAAVRNTFGRGQCIYVGTVLDDPAAVGLLEEIAKLMAIPFKTNLPESLEVVRRVKSGQSYAFYLNHNVEGITVTLDRPGVDLISGAHVSGSYFLPGFGVAIVKEVAG